LLHASDFTKSFESVLVGLRSETSLDDGRGWFDGKGPGATDKEKGDLVVLLAVTQIRMVTIHKDGGAEAEVLKDNYHPLPDGI
jgi:hypothetical protein